jgi:hypothetical protein
MNHHVQLQMSWEKNDVTVMCLTLHTCSLK